MSQSSLKNYVCRLFSDHLESAGETYAEHGKFTLKVGLLLCYCGIIILIHGIFPFLFTRTASGHLEKLHAEMKARAKRSPAGKQDPIEWYL